MEKMKNQQHHVFVSLARKQELESLDKFEGMALSELEKRNYARTKEPMKDTRERSFLEKFEKLFTGKDRPMYREGGFVNMLKKNK